MTSIQGIIYISNREFSRIVSENDGKLVEIGFEKLFHLKTLICNKSSKTLNNVL